MQDGGQLKRHRHGLYVAWLDVAERAGVVPHHCRDLEIPSKQPRITADERSAAAKALRKLAPRSHHARWMVPTDRGDPVALLELSNRGRLPSVTALRYGRMLKSPFAFLHGAAVVMAHDLPAGNQCAGAAPRGRSRRQLWWIRHPGA
jgi:Uncharacterized protein conserved in bacteria (DUF2252)